MAINLAEMAFLSWQAAEEMTVQKDIVTARNYYDGEQNAMLTARLREFLNVQGDQEFNLNVCRTVVEVVEERLLMTGVDSNEQGEAKPVAAWADDLFDQQKLAINQSAVHEGALRDGQSFVLVDWDADNQRPRFTPHPRYACAEAGGDEFGCKAHYHDDDPSQPLLCVSKRWVEKLDTKGKTRKRMTIYYPDRVEKYESVGSDWVQFRDEGDTSWPIPWVDKAGKPLGITAIHFPNTLTLRSEIRDAIPVQNAINKSVIDLLGAADVAGFRIFFARGWIPTTDGLALKDDKSNQAKIQPGSILGTAKTDASFDAIDGSDLSQSINVVEAFLGQLCVVTSTPASRVTFNKQVAAEGTQKEQKEGLFAKTRKRQMLYNNSWIECFNMARRLANTFGNAGLDEKPAFVMRWEPIQARDTATEQNGWKVKKEIGVPLETLLGEMGYSPEEIDAIKATDEWKARMGMMQTGLAVNQAAVTNDGADG